MKKLIKIFAVVFVVLAAMGILLPSLVSKDLVKKKLIEQVQSATGREFKIGGDISVHIFPFTTVTMNDVSLSGIDKSEKKPFVSLKVLDVGVDLFALFKKEVLIKKLVLDDPEINLHINAAGKNNWTFGAKKNEDKSAASGSGQTSSTSALPSEISLSNVKISNAKVTFLDETTKKSWQLDKANLSLSASGLQSPLTAKGSGEWQGKAVKLYSEINTLKAYFDNKKSDVVFTAQSDLFDMEFKGSAERQQFVGDLKIKSDSLKSVQAWLDPKSKSAFQSPLALNLATKADCIPGKCDFKKTSITLDDIKAQGSLSVEYGGRKPIIAIDLDADELNLTPFLPPEQNKQASSYSFISDANAAAGSWSNAPLDFSALNSVNATVNIKAGKLFIRNVKIGKTTLRARVDNGRLSCDVIDADLYSGKGNFTIIADANSYIVEKRISLKNIEAQPFLKDAMNEERLSGKANMQAVFVTRGGSESEMISNLQGNGSLKFLDGSIKGLDIAGMVRNIQSAYKDVKTDSQKTDFAELGGTFTIVNGIVKNSDLAMKAPLMRLSGNGQVDLPARKVNYRLKPEIVQTIQGQGGKDKEGLGVPIIIEGSIDNPTYRPDLAGLAEDALKDPQKIKDTVKSVKEQFKGENKKETIKNIKGLLKGF